MRFVRSHPSRVSRVLAAGLLAAGPLALTAAGPAAADVVPPSGQHPQGPPYGNATTPCPETSRPACAGADPSEPGPSPSSPTPPTPAAEPTDPASSPSVTATVAPAHGPGPGPVGGGAWSRGGGPGPGSGGHTERLWLLGALAAVLAATGLVAKAAMRGRGTR